MSYPILTIIPGKEDHLKFRHHAIFQTSVKEPPAVEDGGIVEVQDSAGNFLCYATYNSKAYICGRAIAFKQGDPLMQMKERMKEAIEMRRRIFAGEDTTGFRLINAEGDMLPGLIVDQYDDTLVIQLTTLGMENLKNWVVETLTEICEPAAIFEKSTSTARRKEGLEFREGWVGTPGKDTITMRERGLEYLITLAGSQKTGLFLDQREMRSLVRSLSSRRTVLDCCSYVGGFSVSALAGGALHADAVDYDTAALARAKEHVQINGLNPEQFQSFSEDVFTFLRRKPHPHNYDFIILDPPAFAKRSDDIQSAIKAYTDMNRAALQILPPGGILLTCSCSYQMTPQMFESMLQRAAREAGRSVKIIQRHRQAMDHTINMNHMEVDYLKSLLVYVQ